MVVTAGSDDEPSGKWVRYTDYYNVEAVAEQPDPYALPETPYYPEKIYINHGHHIFVIPVELLAILGKPRSFLIGVKDDCIALSFSDDVIVDDGFDIPEKVYSGAWKGIHVLGGDFGRELCREMGIRAGLDSVEIEPEVMLEQRMIILPLAGAKRVNVRIEHSVYLLPQWQYEEMGREK